MALETVGFADINSANNYQCGVVAVTFPVCDNDCTKCDQALDTMRRFVVLLNGYRHAALQGKPVGLQQSFSPNYVAYPALDQIEESLDRSYPVIVGISYGKRPQNPAKPQHAVLITGYHTNYRGTGKAWLILRDPYPYSDEENPWAKLGFPYRPATGRVMVPWAVLHGRMNLTSAVFLEKLSA